MAASNIPLQDSEEQDNNLARSLLCIEVDPADLPYPEHRPQSLINP